MNKKTYTLTGILSLLSMSVLSAQVTTDPGDYKPLPAGLDLAIFYLQHTEHEDFYSSGKEVSDAAGIDKLTTDIGVFRWVHYIDLGGYIVDPQIIIPFGEVSLDTTGGTTSSSGVGDPLIGATMWIYNDTKTKKAFGLTGLVSIPVGEYKGSRGPVNIGENRWKLITQAAYTTPLTEVYSLTLIAEYTFFGENDDFNTVTKDQDDQYGIQVHLTKNFTPTTSASLSYYHDFGGETSLNNVKQNDELNNSSFNITLSHFIQPDVQVMIEYGRSIDVHNGFFEDDRLNVRFVKVF